MNQKQIMIVGILAAIVAASALVTWTVSSMNSQEGYKKTDSVPENSIVSDGFTEVSQIKFERDSSECENCWKSESFILDYEQFNGYDGFNVTKQGVMQALRQMGVQYSQDNLIHQGGFCISWSCGYCSYVLADDGREYYSSSGSGVNDHPSGIGNIIANNVRIMDSHSETCRPNYGSCMCSLEEEITARFGPELSYFDESQEKRVAELVRREFETNVANVPSEFELVVGKYNFDYGDNYTEFCGKTSFGREFGGVLSDDDRMIDFHISIDNPKLCAYSESQNNGELRFGWAFGDDYEVFVSKPQFLFPSSQDEDIAATGDNVYVAMTTPYHLGVMVMASHDGGFLFENPEMVNKDLRGVAQNPSISVLGNDIYVVWEETENREDKDSNKIIKVAKSTDNARSFSEPAVLERFSGSSVISDLELLPYDNDTVYVAWVSSSQDSSKLYLAASNDGGNTFLAKAIRDSKNKVQDVKLYECIHGVCIQWVESENIYGRQIEQDSPLDNVTPMPIPKTIRSDIVSYDGNFYTAWHDDSGESLSILFAKASEDDRLYENTIRISDMQLAADTSMSMPMPIDAEIPIPAVAAGNNVVYVTWKYPHDGITSAWLAVSTDDGITFSEPIILNENLNHIVTSHPIVVVTENKMYLSYTGYYEDEDLFRVNVVEATHN